MLNDFVYWAQKIADKSLGRGIDIQVTVCKKSDNSAARLDIGTPTAIARITFWENGDYYAEALNIETEQILFSEQGRFCDGCTFSVQFANFFKGIDIEIS